MSVVIGIAGATAGAVALSVLTLLLSAAMEPDTFGQGQFAVGFAFTVPMGMLLGGVTALVVRQARRGHRTRAGLIAAVGGAIAVAFATAIAWGSAGSRDGGFAEFLSEVRSLWIGPSWLAGALLAIWGTFQSMIRRSSRGDALQQRSNSMKHVVWCIAPLLGLGAMVAPVVVWPPANPYTAPLCPLLRNAQEYLGPGQLILFFIVGMVLGRFNDRHPWMLGFTAVSAFPAVAVAEVGVDPTSHSLLPVELFFYGCYGVLVAAGVMATRRRSDRRDSGAQG